MVWTLARLSWNQILGLMQFAPLEVEALDGVPAHGLHIAALFALPLLGTQGWIIYSRRFFIGNRGAAQSSEIPEGP
jgi:hypothetical protein